jgi:site-specific DNA-cytosine methylase
MKSIARNGNALTEMANPICASDYKDQDIVATPVNTLAKKHIVRRLTPLECCRLQGFPDWWEDGVEGSDSARYKMWGNGIALPCAVDVLRRIAKELQKDTPGAVKP